MAKAQIYYYQDTFRLLNRIILILINDNQWRLIGFP